MHAHASEHGLSLLAEQSVYAQLVIEHRPAAVTDQQKLNNEFYKTYSGRDPVTDVSSDDYTITNLPNTILTLPTNSIYDRILFVSKDSPDFRLVKIDGKNPSQSNVCGDQNVVIFDPEEKLEFASRNNIPNKRVRPLFQDYVPQKPLDANLDESPIAVCNLQRKSDEIFTKTFGNPSTIQTSEVSPDLLTAVREALLQKGDTIYDETMGFNEIMNAMQIDVSVAKQLSGDLAPANYDTVRTGLLLSIQRQLGDNFVVSPLSAPIIARTISDFVSRKIKN